MSDVTITLTNSRYAALHPCSKHPVFLRGTTWRSVIHFFYGEQLSDGRLIYKILVGATADDARTIVADAPPDKRAEWSTQKAYDTVRKAYFGKIMQHATVRNALLRTGDSSISVDLKDCGQWQDDPVFEGGKLLCESLVSIRKELTADGPYDELKAPLLPPWLKFPDYHPYSMGWRMGVGEDYASEFYTWYRGLTAAGKRKYREMYPPPKGWR
jgi:predicted NAD-dependent protein-ADP-ribosyltransferase YbiA (DUF1768 family)